jgi:hypothetical protein
MAKLTAARDGTVQSRDRRNLTRRLLLVVATAIMNTVFMALAETLRELGG